ncbi:SMI1/KNR4 family protein [Peribacillus muralis]|uniref:SMI1/KNR4 family protein n=1 Tax=Peribacillus muralis TaxID=264697 RepID=UPI003D01BEA9
MNEINQAFKIIEDNKEEADFLGKVPMNIINEAEARLDVHFPEDYKKFLSEYGLGDIFGEEIFGLGTEPSGLPNMIWITELLRNEMGIPKKYAVIYNSGIYHEYHAIDCNTGKIILFIEGINFHEQEISIEFSSFGEFFLDLLESGK